MIITHKDFLPNKIRYGFLTKHIPASIDGDKTPIANVFGLAPDNLSILKQQHTNEIVFTKSGTELPIADGQITYHSGIGLTVVTADCVPILMCDEDEEIIASVHAGWRGARANIIENCFKEFFKLGAKTVNAIIGPCIHQNSYEVSQEFFEEFLAETEQNKKFFISSNKIDHYLFDLPGYVKSKLSQFTVNIYDININTYLDENNFFSYRRYTHNPNSSRGLQASVILKL